MRPWLNMTFRREIYILYSHLSCLHYNHHLNHDHCNHDDLPGWFSDSLAAEVSQRFHPAPQQCHRLICSLEKKHLITNIDENGIRYASSKLSCQIDHLFTVEICKKKWQTLVNLEEPCRNLRANPCESIA